ncbi:E3 ubiquitin-protein ligase CCNB1IP1-like [Patiria miniata]|uniref:BZIP domain-containing protein n=1 Tax=Patiria miniata TaxID=46514 RepID=A0A914B6Y9_PATMI|nr:E3 ubiquitin-protein ligase CCNB1IP1-like [Patiria miniata]XP_038071971.1 E3 ubiquitin-protein ligase CCNB1IP1-like [Patiria miniata]
MDEMVCNFKKCRKRLSSFAWVTSCSHIFCDEDGTKEFNKCFACPACETNLSGKFDIVRIDLSPTEQYKSMVLAGQKPDTILEVCTRAMAFWTYQIQQERIYQDYIANKSKERSTLQEQYYEHTVTKLQAENASLKNQVSAVKKDLESSKKRSHDLADKLTERTRQHQKLQIIHDALRRRSIDVRTLDPSASHEGLGRNQAAPLVSYDHPFSSGDESTGRSVRHRGGGGDNMRVMTPAEKEFVLRPTNTPIQTGPATSTAFTMQNRFSMELGTPNEIARRLGHRKT